jgi:hypothetical protein
MHKIKLPEYGYLNSSNELLDKFDLPDGCNDITVDFGDVVFYDISSIVILLAKLHFLVQKGLSVNIENHENSNAFKYMQRMNFFNICGIDINESFSRHASSGRFVDIKAIGKNHRNDTGKLSEEVADCIAPDQKDLDDPEETGFYDGISYSVSELINNVIQHSKSYGFLGAQYYKKDDLTQIVVADIGIGIMQSFIETGSPHASKASTDSKAIELALKAEVSSKTHGAYAVGGAENAGVGLTLLKDIALNSGGSFLVISGDGCFINNNWLALRNSYQGTLVACSFKRSCLNKFDELLEDAKVNNGLTIEDVSIFSGMFEQ